MKITDYKKRFGADPELLEVVFHRYRKLVQLTICQQRCGVFIFDINVIIIAFSTTRCNVCICACICILYLYSYLTALISFKSDNRYGVCIWACVYLYLYLQHLHRCGVCSNLVLFDNDAIAVHLKSGNHPRITHKDYNRCRNLPLLCPEGLIECFFSWPWFKIFCIGLGVW